MDLRLVSRGVVWSLLQIDKAIWGRPVRLFIPFVSYVETYRVMQVEVYRPRFLGRFRLSYIFCQPSYIYYNNESEGELSVALYLTPSLPYDLSPQCKAYPLFQRATTSEDIERLKSLED